MNEKLQKIWIEAEEWAEGEWNPSDDSSDVIVTIDGGKRWIASFFTYKNILSLTENNKITGECLNGQFFWASDMILIDELTRSRIESVVGYVLDEGTFESIFEPIDEES